MNASTLFDPTIELPPIFNISVKDLFKRTCSEVNIPNKEHTNTIALSFKTPLKGSLSLFTYLISKNLHIKIAKYINNTKVNKTYIYGKYIKHTFNKLKPQIKGKILNTKMDIYNLINNDLPNNSLLMVKGSNSTGLNKIIKKL